MNVRTRFAPSPTGELHLGGLRTALYAWLYARHHGGSFYLRIEDTDRQRFIDGSAKRVMDQLRAVGIGWDEGPDAGGDLGPYVQSERFESYGMIADLLIQQGSAYRCDCSRERLDVVRAEQAAAKLPPRYDGFCRDRTVSQNDSHVVRFRAPTDGPLVVRDIIHGSITFQADTVDDFVLLKSDGFPTYHLAHVADDHAMRTSHVIRGDEWLPSLPRHVLLFAALKWEIPEYAHLPLLLGPSGKKLSKRDGDTDVASFLQWCLPDALTNFVALLGWNPSADREIYTRNELIEQFDLAEVHASPAIVNFEKLTWLNGEYIRASDTKQLVAFLPPLRNAAVDASFKSRAMTLEQPRLKRLDAFPLWYVEPWRQEVTLAWKDEGLAAVRTRLSALLEVLRSYHPWPEAIADVASLENFIKAWITEHGLPTGGVLWPMRVALSGKKASPSPFELAWLFGREETLNRLLYAVEHGV